MQKSATEKQICTCNSNRKVKHAPMHHRPFQLADKIGIHLAASNYQLRFATPVSRANAYRKIAVKRDYIGFL